MSYLEIYNENFRDLLDHRFAFNKQMEIKSDPRSGLPYVSNLISMNVLDANVVYRSPFLYSFWSTHIVCSFPLRSHAHKLTDTDTAISINVPSMSDPDTDVDADTRTQTSRRSWHACTHV